MGQFDEYYREHGVTVYKDSHRLPVIRFIPRVRMWARIALNARDLAKLGPFDVVHNHYLSQRDLALGQRIARRFHAAGSAPSGAAICCGLPTVPFDRCAPTCAAATG